MSLTESRGCSTIFVWTCLGRQSLYPWPIAFCWSPLTRGYLLWLKVTVNDDSFNLPRASDLKAVLIWLKCRLPARGSGCCRLKKNTHADEYIKRKHTHVIMSKLLEADHILKLIFAPFNQRKTWYNEVKKKNMMKSSYSVRRGVSHIRSMWLQDHFCSCSPLLENHHYCCERIVENIGRQRFSFLKQQI